MNPRFHIKKFILFLLVSLSFVSATQKQDVTQEQVVPQEQVVAQELSETSMDMVSTDTAALGSPLNPIKVGVLEAYPFAEIKDGHFFGIVIEYWEKIAAINNWHYQYINAGQNYGEVVKDTSKGFYDVTLGNFSTTYERGKLVSFTRPFMLNYAGVLTKAEHTTLWSRIRDTVIQTMLPILVITTIIFFVASAVFWYVEKKRQHYNLSESFFSTSIAMLSGNVVDKPSSNFNRVVFICVLVAGIVFQAVIIATITDAAVIMSFNTTGMKELTDIKNKVFVVEQGSTFVGLVQSLGGRVIEIPGGPSVAAEYYLTHQDEVSGFVADHAVLYTQALRSQDPNIVLSSLNLRNDELVFLYHRDFPYQREIDQGLLFLQDNNIAQTFCATYIGEDSSLCVM
ncbi:MAG: transporter substrate-binding domain-containing protein [Pseudomonadota bacterium]|nr:transporter substrate-binding domain-containing protein [Pseudomonadota bacterium]